MSTSAVGGLVQGHYGPDLGKTGSYHTPLHAWGTLWDWVDRRIPWALPAQIHQEELKSRGGEGEGGASLFKP